MNKLKYFGINLGISYVVLLVFEEFLRKASTADYFFSTGTERWLEFNQMGTVGRYFEVIPWFFRCLGEDTFIGVSGLFIAYDLFIWVYLAYWLTYIRNTTKETNL